MAVMAHEIWTPLHQVIGNLDLLALTQLSKEQLGYIQHVQSSTALLLLIINDLLDDYKLESGKVQVESIPFPLVGLLNACLASVQPQADQRA
jgi:signal transduction histidine kinase